MAGVDRGRFVEEDEEKRMAGALPVSESASDKEDEGQVPGHPGSASSRVGILGRLRGYEEALDRRLGIESHGVARRRPEERDPSYATWSNQAVMFLLWMSATMNLSCFATGFLGWQFRLDLTQNIVIIVFATLAGSAVTVCIMFYPWLACFPGGSPQTPGLAALEVVGCSYARLGTKRD